MNKQLLALTALCLLSAPALAETPAVPAPTGPATMADTLLKKPDPAALAAAEEFVDLTDSAALLDRILPVMDAKLSAPVVRDNPGKGELIKKIFADTFDATLKSHAGEFRTKVATIYANELSIDDLKKLTEFYKSPPGQAYIKAMPKIGEQTMKQSQLWAVQNMREAQQKLLEELKKNNLTLPKEYGGKGK